MWKEHKKVEERRDWWGARGKEEKIDLKVEISGGLSQGPGGEPGAKEGLHNVCGVTITKDINMEVRSGEGVPRRKYLSWRMNCEGQNVSHQ